MCKISFLQGYLSLCCALALSIPDVAMANVVIGGTRVVYPAQEREVTLKLTNEGDQPALMQAWADTGNPDTKPDRADAPFLITPPIARIESGKGQVLRLTFTGQALPKDRESLFWLNVLDVPPLPGDLASNYMQLAYRTRIKLFYRPEGLPGTPEDAAMGLVWELRDDVLRARNASPYHVSLNSVVLLAEGKRSESLGNGTVAPGGVLDLPLTGLKSVPASSVRVIYHWVSDYGASTEHQALAH